MIIKMKNNNIGLLIFLTLGLSSGACKKQLNVYPTTAEVDGNLITDQASAQAVLNGVYYEFAAEGLFGDPLQYWTNVNEVIPSELAGSLVLSYYFDAFYTFTVTPASPHSDYLWSYGYTLVNGANGFIKNAAPVATIPVAAKQQMMAEAAFLRAFGNSELLLYYGQYNDPSSKYGIILRDAFVTPTIINLPRSSVAAAYTSILADLNTAIDGLPILNTAIYYANVSDAKLLEARVLMNRGAPGDYAQVIALTNDIITNGPFVLEDSLKDIFLTNGFSSQEVMLGVQPNPKSPFKYTDYTNNYSVYLATDSLVSLLAGDARNQWVYKTINSPFGGTSNEVTKYYSGDPVNTAPTPLSNNCYAFRLSEAYLLEAEAITLSGGDLPTAKTLLTTVMSHAGAGAREMAAVANATTPAALQLEIVKENLRNFAFENGVDWFALRRLPFATMQSLNPNITDPTKLILPIPASELNENNVSQNPGY
jgi:starch-binding outer membrane protein, SusD/RagB family